MLNVFPELFSYSLFTLTLFRIVIGLIIIRYGWAKLIRTREVTIQKFEQAGIRPGNWWVNVVGLIELIGGIAIIIGLYTQVAALVLGVLTITALVIKQKHPAFLPHPRVFYILLVFALLMLLFFGAGLFAFDLPRL